MPDYWTIYNLILAVIFGMLIGITIGLWGNNSSNRKRKHKPNEEIDGYFLSIIEKISQLEAKFDAKRKVNSSYDSNDPIKSSLSGINDRLKDILSNKDVLNFEKKIRSKGQPDKSILTRKIELTEDLSKESIENTHQSLEYSVKEIPFNSFEEQEIELQGLSSQITTLYNRGINDRSDRDLFWERFSITRIGNANSVAQRLGEVSAPDFREAGNGDFLAIESDTQSCYVVPLFDTTITPSAFNEGGISYAFDCGDYDLQSARSILRVKKAAIFRRDDGQWILIEGGKGELVLQN